MFVKKMFCVCIFLICHTTLFSETVIDSSEITNWIQNWISDEKDTFRLGVLATVDSDGIPHSRTVHIREIDAESILFFTQKGSEKVQHLEHNPNVSMTLVLQENKRQITFEGSAEPLTRDQNIDYWTTYSKQGKIRFLVYGPLSGNLVSNNEMLDAILSDLNEKYEDIEPAYPEAYVGYRIKPKKIKLYQINSNKISDSFLITNSDENWHLQKVVP